SLRNCSTFSGATATRRSPRKVSLGIPMIIQKKEVHPSGSNRGSCKGKVIAIKNAPAIHEF
ncbi:MAG: hypothetical protein O3B25_10635, partial [Verrucomicrobia bacterium]|nr:hypothetical protein [Verrucomicrobiota bacterium]